MSLSSRTSRSLLHFEEAGWNDTHIASSLYPAATGIAKTGRLLMGDPPTLTYNSCPMPLVGE